MTYSELHARANAMRYPRSYVWGPTIGFRSIAWVRAYVDASPITNHAPKEG